MKKNIITLFTAILSIAVVIAACSKEPQKTATPGGGDNEGDNPTPTGSYDVTASATIFGEGAAWATGDSFAALQDGAGLTFSTKGSGSSASFSGTAPAKASEKTVWKAVQGKGVTVTNNSIVCSYLGQDGTLKGLSGYDYVVTGNVTGATPSFDFSKGTRLSAFVKLTVPAGIRTIEFCAGDWTISADKDKAPAPNPSAIGTAKLSATSTAGQAVYFAVPAINYTYTGLIVTVISEDGKKSQGKVFLPDFTEQSGTTLEAGMSDLELMDRALPSEAADFGDAGKWAPFNMGAKADPKTIDEYIGKYYTWGELEDHPDHNYTESQYPYKNENGWVEIGNPTYIVQSEENQGNSYDISGTMYDVARVKWGRDWCMPTHAQGKALPNKTSSAWEEDYNEIADLNGRVYTSRTDDKQSIFIPAAGYYKNNDQKLYSLTTKVQWAGEDGTYWLSCRNTNTITSNSAILYQTAKTAIVTFRYRNDGRPVRAVINPSGE